LPVSDIYIIVILYDFCLLPAYFVCIIVDVWNLERPESTFGLFAPWLVTSGAGDSVLQALQFQNMADRRKLPRGAGKSFWTSLMLYKGSVLIWRLIVHFSKVSRC
jgi:hypothetical protein